MTHSKYGFRLSATAAAVGALLMTSPIHAQEEESETATQQAGTLERIEVTARRTVESLQEVPVAVTSVSAADLQARGITVLTEVQQFSPNTTLQTSRGTNSTLTAFIRGVGQQDPLWGYEPGVGIYIDDVYIARPQGAVLDLLNVQRVEVLRGPQGTLYGKNTIGGAVKYVTKEMSGDTEFNAQATLGSYSQQDIMVTGQIPLIEDKLYVGGGYANLTRDGFGEFLISALPDQDLENYNKDLWAARIAVEYSPTDKLFFRLDWDKTEDTSNSKGGFRLLPSILTNAPVPDSVYDSYTSLPTENLVEVEGLSFLARYDVSDNLQLKYIASSRESYSPTNIDFDNTPVDVFDVPAIYEDENTTHELQANYIGDAFTVTGGLYYYDGESCGSFDAILGALGRIAFGVPGLTREVAGCNNSESVAAYTQADFELTDKLSITVGARYTEETKEAFVNNGLIFANVYPESGWIPGYVRPAGTFPGNNLVPQVLGQDTNGDSVLDAPSEETWSRFTPRLGLDYKVSDDMMIFASFSQGFKSGTFNPRATINENAVNPEVVDSLEVGIKADLSDNLRTNVTVFSLDHKDRQYISVLPVTSPEDLNQVLGNVGESTATGLEAEITWVATESLTFDVALGYIDADFEEVISIGPGGQETDISDQFAISNTPEYTANFAANYMMDTDVGYFMFTANYYYRDDYNIDETANSLLSQDGYGLFNVSATWESVSGQYYAGLHLKNITDEEYLVGGYQFVTPDGNGGFIPGTGGDNTLIGYYGDPRTVHLTVGYRF
ncbi:TonB-dependent receptor [Glaciecola sp. XM2]|uniref:TonB-dependent receptor n=1 Tax=Glaciecola sp. XM2 TaxID=1914931 RepID=UPI001BDF01CF|nr:TonB-dependent receptor [Glaciecola sp. XM2]MBT1450988.1 TonB-dependent receptor [Glaciecola sp. XM2]